MRILFDSKNPVYKKPFGCLRQDEKCEISIHIPKCCPAQSVVLKLEREDGFQKEVVLNKSGQQDEYEYFSASFTLEDCGLYFYWFVITTNESSFNLYKWGYMDTNIEEGQKWQITCYEKNYDTPKKFKGNVMYQIFPDRFYRDEICDTKGKLEPFYIHDNTDDVPVYLPDSNGKIQNNDFYGGNLKGIEKKLKYIKDLGVETIYLNPIFKAYSNHRYDTCDYKTIDPLLGCEEDFISLCNKAHSMGIKIILDGVFSHTGSNSIYFDKDNIFGGGAYSCYDSPYKSWYNFKTYPNEYDSWWGIDTLPCVNEMDESYIEYILTGEDSVVKHWLKCGADGFRLDVADELPDEFIKLLHEVVKKEKPDALVIGEVWEDASNKISYSKRRKYFVDTELDSVMNYPFQNAIIALARGDINVQSFKETVMTICENYPKPVVDCLMNSLSTHDTSRILTKLSDANEGMAKVDKANFNLTGDMWCTALSREYIAVMLQFMLPGSSCIYYGDEIGMQGFNDPFNRGYFKWNEICGEIYDYYKFFGNLKSKSSALKYGDVSIDADCDVLTIKRTSKDGMETIVSVLNMSDKPVCYDKKPLISHNSTCFSDKVYICKGGFAVFS